MKRWVEISLRVNPRRLGGLIAFTLIAFGTYVWLSYEDVRNWFPKKLAEIRAERIYRAFKASGKSLTLSNLDERVLLHLPRRGLPGLATLLDSGNLYTWANSMVFGSAVERQAATIRVLENRRACFLLVRELAPSPEALRFDKQAEELATKISSISNRYNGPFNTGPTQNEFWTALASIRDFYDQLKNLPKMSPEEFAWERAESAVMAPGEYLDKSFEGKWPYAQLERQDRRGKEGYLLAYAERTRPDDYERFQMVVKKLGGIFEANQVYSGSHFHPDSCESKLSLSEIRGLEDVLARLPPSDASGDEIQFILSFSKDGNWTTRTYRLLPEGIPFKSLLNRMIHQSAVAWMKNVPKNNGFLLPESKHQ